MGRVLAVLALAAATIAEPVTFNQNGLASSVSLFQNGTAVDVRMEAWAPLSAGWGAVGLGTAMENALMFVLYPSSNNQAVTVSARTAPGHVEPEVAPDITTQVTNSSIDQTAGTMWAQFVCYGCTKWSTGTLNTASSSQSFIYAIGPGGQAGSDAPDAEIHRHSENGMFSGNIANAFLATGASASAPAPASTPAQSSSSQMQPSRNTIHTQIVTHAVLMCLVFFGLMPSAVVLLRLPFLGRAAFKVHASIQIVAFAAAIAAMGVAINMSKHMHTESFKKITNFHQIIGITVTSIIIVQVLGGIVQHLIFKKEQRRTAVSYAHIVFGWIIITLGMLNGCLGLWLAENNKASGGLGAAGVVIFLIMLGVSLWAGWRRKRENAQAVDSPNFPFVQRGSDADQKERMAYTWSATGRK